MATASFSSTSSNQTSYTSFSGSTNISTVTTNLWAGGNNSGVSPPVIPPLLLKGGKFDIWTDESGQTIEMDALLRVDESGLFIVWKSQGKESVVVDCLQVSDIRQGSSPKDAALAWDLELKGSGSLNYRTICICTGTDFVSQNYIYVAAYDETEAKTWTDALRKVVHSPWNKLTAHASPMWQLHKTWLRLRLTTDPNGRLLGKTVAKALGSHSSPAFEIRVFYETMQGLGILAMTGASLTSQTSASLLTSPNASLTGQQSFQFSSIANTSSNASSTLSSVSSTLSLPFNDDVVIDFDSFTFDKFFSLYRRLCSRPEIEAIFISMCEKGEKGTISPSVLGVYPSCTCSVPQLKKFLNDNQRDPSKNEILHPFYEDHHARQIIDAYEPDSGLRSRNQLSYIGFLRYILCESDPIDINMLNNNQDLDQPLTHYYVSTSHNTYLAGRQFGGKSYVEMYRVILLSGCRSVELDCWDGNNGEPIITHGKAMCTDISYRDVLLAIKETAFLTSSLPVTLSFENHCSRQQQLKIAKYAEEIFGDMLLREPLPTHPLRPGVPLPSPNQLRYKILIKNKRLRPEVERQQLELFLKGLLKADDIADDSGTADAAAEVDIDGGSNSKSDAATISSSKVKVVLDSKELSDTSRVGANGLNAQLGRSSEPRKSISSRPVINSNSVDVTGDDAALLELTSETSESTNTASVAGTENAKVGRETPGTTITNSSAVSSNKSNLVTSIISSAANKVIPSNRKNAISGLLPDEEAALLANYQYQGATVNVHPYLSSLINYTQPIKFQGFDVAEARNIHYNMSSFNENGGLALLKEQAIEFVNYNKRQFSRIYPKGSRYDSSNFNPQVFWAAGCQMVALNFQTLDIPMQLNQGRFEYNERSGYLLKPEILRRCDRNNFNPFSEAPVDGVIAASCTVQVISAQFLSQDRRCGSYVEVDMYGLPADTIRKEFRTRQIPANGLNPVYLSAINGDLLPGAMVFRKVVLPDLAVLRLAIFDETGRLLGQRILPFNGLQAGYRHLTLRSDGSVPLPVATLFCRFILNTYVPEGIENFAILLSDPLAFDNLTKKNVRRTVSRTKSADQELMKDNNSNADSNSSPPPEQRSVSPTPRKASSRGDSLTNSDKLSDTMTCVEQLQIRSKSYQKLVRHQQRELQKLKKRQNNEKLSLANRHYKQLSANNSSAKSAPSVIAKIRQSSSGDLVGRNNRIGSEANTVVSQLVESTASSTTSKALENQAHEYAELMQKCIREECDCQIKQAEARINLAKALLVGHQEQQTREFTQRHESEFKKLELQQARQMKESVSRIVDDKSISSKEKDRKVKELKESNIKRFCEERKRLDGQHKYQQEQLTRFQASQMEILTAKLAEEIRQIESAYEEERIGATQPQFLV